MTQWTSTTRERGDLRPTPSQTIGPFFGYALPYDDGEAVVPAWHRDAILVHGRVLDGAGVPLPDALVESWQAAPDGTIPTGVGALHRTEAFSGFGRSATDRDGHYRLHTLRPGVPPADAARGTAPHLALLVFARGLLKPVWTRVYLPEQAEANAADPLLRSLDERRRATLVAERDENPLHGVFSYRFDVHLQGEQETAFLAW